MSELTKRVAVAAIAIPTVLALLYVGGGWLAVPLAVLAAAGAHELNRLARARGVQPFDPVGTIGAAAIVIVAGGAVGFADFAPGAIAVVGISAGASTLAALFLRAPGAHPLGAISGTVLGVVYVGMAMAFVPLLHALPAAEGWARTGSGAWAGLAAVALPLAATWVGDSAAFFAGSAWGTRKLAPAISPNKSWVGFWAGVLGAAAGAVLWLFTFADLLPGLSFTGSAAAIAADTVSVGRPVSEVVLTAFVGAALGLAAVLGDLVESLLKREAGVKDSGSLFPGHGGVLDRVDSLLFTVPIAYVLLVLLAGRG